MSSQAELASLVLTRRLADGTVEWIPLTVPQHVAADPGAAYALIDRTDYAAPQAMVAQRQADNLVIAVNETEVLVLDGFFVTPAAAFYPTPDVAGGAGPFSGTPLSPESPVLAGYPDGQQVVWSAEPGVGDAQSAQANGQTQADGGGQVAANAAGGSGGAPLLWGGLAVGGLGLALAGGGGGSGGGGSGGGDTVPPQITSGTTATSIPENSGAGQVVYTATATDTSPVTWSLAAGGDAAAFSINATTGAVTLTGNPDFETKSSYSFTVVATDAANNRAQQAVSLGIQDLDDSAPMITSGATAAAINENSGADQVVYTATATDQSPITWSLAAGGDATAFSINPNTGAVRLTGNPNFEAKSSYSFTVVATDAGGDSSEQAVSLAINNLDEVAPTITSGATATAVNENSGANQVVYTVTSTDTGDISTGSTTYSLGAGGDGAAFSINASTGAVRLTGNPNFEAKASYSFTVVARDAAGNSSQRTVSLAINNLDEVAPTITSAATAPAITENSGANQVVYTATSTDTGDISTGNTTYSLGTAGDGAAFSINSTTGVVRLTANPDFETKSSYNFTVVATDAAGNSSQKAVSLAINDIADETAPTVSSVAITSAVGALNNTLNAGDTVRVTVTMSEATVVDTAGGTPRIALNVGGTAPAHYANYVSGSGTNALIFAYIVQPGDTDSNGISIAANSLQLNGGVLRDATGNVANLGHGAVADNPLFLVDTTVPNLSSSTPPDGATDVALASNIVLTFSEGVRIGTGNITISDGTDTRIINVTDASQVSVSGTQVTINPTADLNPASAYNVQIASGAITDAAGNAYAGISNSTTLNFDTGPDTSVVVFDLVQGSSSDHSGRTFASGVSYDIYIRVPSDDSALSTSGGGPGTWGRWGGTANLGSDDRIILVGSGTDVQGPSGPVTQVSVNGTIVAWSSAGGMHAGELQGRSFVRFTSAADDNARLFDQAVPGAFLAGQEGQVNTMYFVNMPAGILTSQGLV